MGDRLLWRCRRGLRELDTLMQGYYRRRYQDSSDADKATFEALLDEADPDILAWIMFRQDIPPRYSTLIQAIRSLESTKA
ncbi:MAG: succinate dehydrogenase assembly factor 2 [Gammaproteobacteria bacterium]|nr:succinate dehydrogenase assembly factor 2 [Gammaproteobacteria bacterium]